MVGQLARCADCLHRRWRGLAYLSMDARAATSGFCDGDGGNLPRSQSAQSWKTSDRGDRGCHDRRHCGRIIAVRPGYDYGFAYECRHLHRHGDRDDFWSRACHRYPVRRLCHSCFGHGAASRWNDTVN